VGGGEIGETVENNPSQTLSLAGEEIQGMSTAQQEEGIGNPEMRDGRSAPDKHVLLGDGSKVNQGKRGKKSPPKKNVTFFPRQTTSVDRANEKIIRHGEGGKRTWKGQGKAV